MVVGNFFTASEIPVKTFYTPSEMQGFSYEKNLGDPGAYPFTRGIYPGMYRSKLWTMRQYAGYGSAGETNQRFKLLLKEGQMGISVAFDLPTQMGYDPDDPKALGEVGRVGVSIAALEDMERLFDGIPVGKVSTSMTINSTAAILLALYTALGEKHGVAQDQLAGTVQNDILKEYIARGTYIYPLPFSMRLAVDIIEYCTKFMPKMNPISISGYHMREAGATAVQEVAFTFANALAYLEESQKRGLSIEELGPKISFFFACHNHFFEEIAKFRAARRLWAQILKERFHVKNEKALMLRFHTQTAGSTLTSQQPLNNVVRVSLQALAAVLGGTQSLHTNAYDEALALPSQESATLALRTQQIIAYESGAAQTADPLGGSYAVESLTQEVFEKAKALLSEVESKGGALECVHTGYFERAIHQSAYAYQQQVESRDAIVVGVNAFSAQDEPAAKLMKIDPKLEDQTVDRIRKIKQGRDGKTVVRLLDELRQGAISNENLIPSLIQAVQANITLGEICSIFRALFGEHDSGTFHGE